ncbi:MAG: hypothetical protein HRT57_06285 [Crocinitomicaceae bacterium]|nr:hypothetical protein [Crocinitomicaceae bacterium]
MRLILFIFSLTGFQVCSQETYFVKDAFSESSIPFVKVFPNDGEPFLADIDGAFDIQASTSTFQLKSRGFRDTTINVASITDSIVYLMIRVQQVDEITVVPGVNPAHRIMKKAIENRKANHPLKNDAFRYNSYSKFIFDINLEDLAAISDTTTDSTIMEMRKFFESQHLFMLESSSRRTFIPPYRDQEEITAYKVSGFTDPIFSTFANGMQSFSFYDNQFDLLGSHYINPLAFGGINRYLFVLEDSTFHETDTTYTIYYRPRKGKTFNGLEGRLYINTNGFAVEKVIAQPYNDTTGMQVKIVQEYEFIDGKKWFPTKLNTEVDFGAVQWGNGGFNPRQIGTGQTYIEDIELNPSDLAKGFNNNITIFTAEDANEQNENEWDSLRRYDITDKELRTYEMIDSLSEAMGFEKKLNYLKALTEGKLPIGNYALDLTRLMRFNFYERCRFGLGLENSKKLMKNVVIGGYFGWATGDKEWKYGGYSTIHLSRKRGMKIDLKYQQDIYERGGNNFMTSGFNLQSTDALRFLFISSMDRQRLGEVAFTTDIKANMSVRIFGNYQRIGFTNDYRFLPSDGTYSSPVDVDLAEIGFEFKWNILEKYMLLGNKKVSQGIKYPTMKFKLARGGKGWFESNLDYLRMNAEIAQTFDFIGVGKLKVKVEAGKTVGKVPLFLTHVGNGTGQQWMTSVANTFETMAPGTFYSSEQAALFTRFEFRSFKTKAKWNEPKISLHHAIGYGRVDDQVDHVADFRTMENGYYEGGLILDGLYISSLAGLGIGVFYNYGSYADTDWEKNIMPKIALSFSID